MKTVTDYSQTYEYSVAWVCLEVLNEFSDEMTKRQAFDWLHNYRNLPAVDKARSDFAVELSNFRLAELTAE
jgi:hypothetical protein